MSEEQVVSLVGLFTDVMTSELEDSYVRVGRVDESISDGDSADVDHIVKDISFRRLFGSLPQG